LPRVRKSAEKRESIQVSYNFANCMQVVVPLKPAPNKKNRIARNAKTAPTGSSRRASLQPSSVFFGAARGLSEMRRV
jgi:hypothetical protein